MRVVLKSVLLLLSVAMILSACERKAQAPQESPAEDDNAATEDLEVLLARADPERGETLYLQCRACHSLGEGEPHKVGPNLHGIFGQPAGAAPGFPYSRAMSESGVVWTPETMDAWLARPGQFMPGNKMVFIGIRDPIDRAHLIAYLQRETRQEP